MNQSLYPVSHLDPLVYAIISTINQSQPCTTYYNNLVSVTHTLLNTYETPTALDSRAHSITINTLQPCRVG
jgi:hypothetical protein